MRKLVTFLIALFPALALGAAPTVDDTAVYDAAGSASTHNVNIPNPCASGKTLLMLFSSDDSADTVTPPSGWTTLSSNTAGSSRGTSMYKKSNGSEGSTAAVTVSAVENAAAVTYCIGGAADPTVTAPEDARSTGGSPGTNPNPPSLTPSGGSDDYLYVVYGAINSNVSTSVYPTGYTGTTQASSTGGNVTAIGAYKGTTSSTSDDPSAMTISSSQDYQVYTISITPAAAASPPAWSITPAVQSRTNTSYTMVATPDSSATWYAVAVNMADGTPTCTQIKAGQNDAGAAAIGSANKAVTGVDTLTVGSLTLPGHDIHSCLSNANGDSAVASLNDQARTADSGQEIVQLTSVSTTSVFDTDTYYDPDVATSDVFEADSATNEDSFAITWETDGDFSYTDTCGGCRQSIDYCIQDLTPDDGKFTVPDCWGGTDDVIWINNSAPTAEPYGPLVLDINTAMTSIDVCAEFTDADSDTLTMAVSSGTLPTGLSLGSTGNCTLSGTPTVEDETGAVITFQATDVVDTGDMEMTIYVIDTITMPTLTDSDLVAALADELASFPWRAEESQLTATFKCSTQEAALQVTAQSPAASTEVEANQAISVTVSSGDTCARRRMNY